MIHYIEDDLFNASDKLLLVHACNCQGVWGSGVAALFKRKFPKEFLIYMNYCIDNNVKDIIGTALITNRVGCLFTSKDYGQNIDSLKEILMNTEKSLDELLKNNTMDIAMPKINSGLFKVPWEETEKVINKFNRNFYVFTGEKK